ncbi:MAG: hypothetical protein WD801_00015 [Gemmatimonadaceae bacterium]
MRLLALVPALGVTLAAAANAAPAQESRVVFERTGYRLTALGARLTVNARVLDARARPVPDARIARRNADPAIATVNEQGVVVSRRVGRTRLWAVSGTDSASALLLVDQWAASFSFTPAIVRLDAVGQNAPLRVQARDAAGNVIGGLTGNCRSTNDRIAQLSGAMVVARGNGIAWVRCTDRGIADSARVEVRQRPLRIAIVDKNSMPQYAVGESFQLRLQAFDSEDGEIRDARPTWASLNPRAINIDPLTGTARAIGLSDNAVKVVAQLGDATDTVAITVRAGAGISAPVVAEADGANSVVLEAPPSASLRINQVFTSVGDTATLSIAARDAAGTTVSPELVRVRSTDTSVVRYIGRQRVVGLKIGNAFLIAAYESLSDSAPVSVQPRGMAAALTSSGSATSFVRPTYDLDAARARNRVQLDSVRNAILTSSPIRARLTRMISASGTVEQAAHAVRLPSALLDARSGLLFGGTVAIMPVRKLVLTGDFRTGTLTPTGSVTEDMRVTEADGRLTFSPWDWFSLRTGYTVRAQATETATQQWHFASVTGLARFRFVGGAVSTIIGGSLLPWGTYTGQLDANGDEVRPEPTSYAGEAGLELSTRFFTAGMTYYVERFSFPLRNQTESARVDQFSTLRLRLGLQLGR